MIDSKLLQTGQINYNDLNDLYIIMIAPFDLFGLGRFRYDFSMMCADCPGLQLNDGACRIFLNTHGECNDGASCELISLLQYIEHSDDQVAMQSGSDRIKRIHKKVEAIKLNEEVGIRFMNAWEEKIIEQQRAREKGLAEGRAEGREKGLAEGRAEGRAEEKNDTAIRLKAMGLTLEQICEATKLTKEEIRQIIE